MNERKHSMKEEAPTIQKAFYNSAAWKRCRKEYMSYVGNLCERCAAKGLIVPARIVHHKEWITTKNINDPNVLIDFDNLEALCTRCHNEEHDTPEWMKRKAAPQREVQFTIEEDGTISNCERPSKLFGSPRIV